MLNNKSIILALLCGLFLSSQLLADPRLFALAKKGRAAPIKWILDDGADIDAKEVGTGDTMLHIAAREGHTELVHLLLQRGARRMSNAAGQLPDIGGIPLLNPLAVDALQGNRLPQFGEMLLFGNQVSGFWRLPQELWRKILLLLDPEDRFVFRLTAALPRQVVDQMRLPGVLGGVSIVDNLPIIERIAVGWGPAAMSEAGPYLFVANWTEGTITIIERETFRVMDCFRLVNLIGIDMDWRQYRVHYDAVFDVVYVLRHRTGTLAALLSVHGNSGGATEVEGFAIIPTYGAEPFLNVFDRIGQHMLRLLSHKSLCALGKRFYVLRSDPIKQKDIIHVGELIEDDVIYRESIDMAGYVTGPIFATERFLFVADRAHIRVFDIPKGIHIDDIILNELPEHFIVVGNYLYVTHFQTGEVSVIKVATWRTVATLDLGGSLTRIYASGNYLYVLDQENDQVIVIDISGYR